MSSRLCARKGCRSRVVHAWDVGSWFKLVEQQRLRHYEVCDEHASYFSEPFDRERSEAVQRDLIEYDEMIAPCVGGVTS